jgi:hypothetical protein
MMTLLDTFIRKKLLRQGDPLSPMLFNIVTDMLVIIIEHAKVEGHIEGVVPRLVDGSLTIFRMSMIQLYLWNTNLRKQEILR